MSGASGIEEILSTNATQATSDSLRPARLGQERLFVTKCKSSATPKLFDCYKPVFRRGCSVAQERNGWPQNVWAVTGKGEPLEAQLEGDGVYHGYPMPEADPFRDKILERWTA